MQITLSVLRALADPSRLRIVALVRGMELAVGELALVLGQSQPRVSRHVKILADAGLVVRHKEGAWVFVRLGKPARVDPVLALLDALEAYAAASADNVRLAAVRAERATASEAYFAAHAAEWDEIRSLHVADEAVEAAVIKAMGGRQLGSLIDIGTGTGRMIELLGSSATTALGIDRSPEMLRIARTKIEAAGVAGAQVRHGDMYALPVAGGAADTVILHQVLHYAQEPADAIIEAARVLRPGGCLLIVDFAPHAREEFRSHHAHARLGFEDSAVTGWMAAAGLEAGVVATLPGDLTVTLWLGRRASLVRAAAA